MHNPYLQRYQPYDFGDEPAPAVGFKTLFRCGEGQALWSLPNGDFLITHPENPPALVTFSAGAVHIEPLKVAGTEHVFG